MPFRTSCDIGWQERDGHSGWYGARGRTPAGGGGASLTKSVSLSSRVRSDVGLRPESQISWINCVNILTWARCFQRQFSETRCVVTNLLLSVRIFIVSDLFGRTCKHIEIKHDHLMSFDVSLYRIGYIYFKINLLEDYLILAQNNLQYLILTMYIRMQLKIKQFKVIFLEQVQANKCLWKPAALSGSVLHTYVEV